jgi:hypothetical protein
MMTKREAYIQHCGTLGISRGLAELMADAPDVDFSMRCSTAASQVCESFTWWTHDEGGGFWDAVFDMLKDMAKKGECK